MGRLDGKVALITGAGSGFGREAALLFAREGASVTVADIDEAGGSDTASRIASEGGRAIFIRTNVAHPGEVRAMVEETVRTFGRLNVLYNNAGVPMLATPIAEISEEQYAHVLDVNLKGVLFGCCYGAPEIARAGGGAIINTASVAALKGRPNVCIYAASKGAITAVTRALAVELAEARIRVNAICPAAAGDTPMLPKFMREPGAGVEAMLNAMAQTIPMKRLCRATDVAAAALFLASDDAVFVTGLSMTVDGGYTA